MRIIIKLLNEVILPLAIIFFAYEWGKLVGFIDGLRSKEIVIDCGRAIDLIIRYKAKEKRND